MDGLLPVTLPPEEYLWYTISYPIHSARPLGVRTMEQPMKHRVLEILEQNRDGDISGSKIAAQLGITRAAVWKAIRALEKEGHRIEAVPRRGYRLLPDSDVLSAEAIGLHLATRTLGRGLVVLPSVDSTNTYLKNLALRGAQEGTTVVADCQTGGRGRLGRTFVSPAGCGIYMSVLFRPKGSPDQSALITACGAVAVARAVEEVTGVSPQIKWVNDLMVEGRKICGILTEAAMELESGGLDYLIVGIGINVRRLPEEFPQPVRQVAGAIDSFAARPFSRSQLAAAVLNHLEEEAGRMDTGAYLEEYRARSCVLGRPVTVVGDPAGKVWQAVEIDDQARLVVEDETGARQVLNSREISVRTL